MATDLKVIASDQHDKTVSGIKVYADEKCKKFLGLFPNCFYGPAQMFYLELFHERPYAEVLARIEEWLAVEPVCDKCYANLGDLLIQLRMYPSEKVYAQFY